MMVQVIPLRIGISSLKRSDGIGSDAHIVDFEVATKEAKASEEIGLNCESGLVGKDTKP